MTSLFLFYYLASTHKNGSAIELVAQLELVMKLYPVGQCYHKNEEILQEDESD